MALDLNALNGPQRKIVRDAFLSAFDRPSFELLLDELDLQLANLAGLGTFEHEVFQVINASRRQAWTDRLIEAAEAASGHARIRGLRQDLETVIAIDLEGLDQQVKKTAPGGLERIVREGGFADWGLWVAKMGELGRQICSIEYPVELKSGGGTGFLVAPDLVLTNYHVIELHQKELLAATTIRCRFDFAHGQGASELVELAPDWLIDASPYSPHDPGDAGGLPDPVDLDYALLRLGKKVGDQILSGSRRGFIQLEKAPVPAAGSIVFIGQHPGLQPLKLAVGAVIGTNPNQTRLRYDANTECGSSGSPCFDSGLAMVAIHHGGDPDYSKLHGKYNQGIPITRVLDRLASRGVAKFWK